jgi:hypothetical protein
MVVGMGFVSRIAQNWDGFVVDEVAQLRRRMKNKETS